MAVLAVMGMFLGAIVYGERPMRRRQYYLRHAAGYARQLRMVQHMAGWPPRWDRSADQRHT
jgi:hypothetical protein